MLGRAKGKADVVDAHIVFLARDRDWSIVTSDPRDLLALDETLSIERV
jgi:hypothetical protein